MFISNFLNELGQLQTFIFLYYMNIICQWLSVDFQMNFFSRFVHSKLEKDKMYIYLWFLQIMPICQHDVSSKEGWLYCRGM